MVAHSGDDFPAYAPDIREEKATKFGGQFAYCLGINPQRSAGNPELLLEGCASDAEMLWQVAALACAALQRMAHDQAEILAGTLGTVVEPLSGTIPAAQDRPPPPSQPSAMIGVISNGLLRSLGEVAQVIGQSSAELNEIVIEHLGAREAALWQFLGLG